MYMYVYVCMYVGDRRPLLGGQHCGIFAQPVRVPGKAAGEIQISPTILVWLLLLCDLSVYVCMYVCM